jgi:hypothetical protein
MNSSLSTFPPLVFLAGPWLFLALVLSGPFLLVLMVIVAALLLPIVPLLIAVPYLVVRSHSRRRREVETYQLRAVTA